jgi:hypothetical protein
MYLYIFEHHNTYYVIFKYKILYKPFYYELEALTCLINTFLKIDAKFLFSGLKKINIFL